MSSRIPHDPTSPESAHLPPVSQTSGHESDDTIDVLDVLLTLAENLKWLILLPVIGGAIVYGLASLLPEKFESTAIIKADGSVSANMTAAHVLDAALKNLGYLDQLDDEEAEDAREHLQRNVSTSVVRGTQLVTLKVAGHSQEAVHRITQEILNMVYLDSRPREAELKRLGTEKAMLEAQAVELTATSKTAQKLLGTPTAGTDTGALAESIASISSNMVRIQAALLVVEAKMHGLSNDDLVQAPTFPQRPVGPKKALIAAVAAVVIGLLALIFVLMRQSWRTSRAIDLHADRLAALKRRYHLG